MQLHREEIGRDQWQPFMDRFSRMHRGWRVSLGTIDTELMQHAMEAPARTVHDDAVFEGLRLDERVGGEQITVVLGLQRVLASHTVREPRHLFVERSEQGADESLRVDSSDGTSLLLQFRAAAPTETVDGISPAEL